VTIHKRRENGWTIICVNIDIFGFSFDSYDLSTRSEGDLAKYLAEVMIFPEVLCPEGNIITEGNTSTNPSSGGPINDILYRS
jgi:hypothetical protein